MTTNVFSVFDKKARAFGLPYFAPTLGVGIRTFSDAVSDAQSMWSKHPEDYDLYHIGSYDDEDASLHPIVPTVRLVGALDVVPQKN